jgi:hypothetical protein
MDYITPDEFKDWLAHPTTQKVKKAVLAKVLEEKMLAVQQMGVSQLTDRYKAGLIAGMEVTANFEGLFQGEEEDGIRSSGTQSSY